MKIRFTNAKILTSEGIVCGELWTKDDKIYSIGSGLDDETADVTIDAADKLIFTGFKNAHTHSAMTFLRSYAEDLPLKNWLFDKVFPAEAKLTEDDVYYFTKLAILEYLSAGTNACFDMYYFKEAIAKATVDTGFRMVLVGGSNDLNEDTSVKLKEIESDFKKFNAYSPNVSYKMGFHAEYTCSEKFLRGVGEIAEAIKLPVYTHNSETKAEVVDCLKRTGYTPTQYLNSLSIFNYGGGAFHGIYLDHTDMKIFREKGLYLVTNPCSNLKLSSGVAPLYRYRKNGIKRIAIGTDGPASNNALDMFRETYLALVLQKTKTENAAESSCEEVLKYATVNGAKAMGLDASSELAVGNNADLVVVDLNAPNMRPLNNPLNSLVLAASPKNVELTMVAGKILYNKGQYFVGEDVESIYENVEKRVSRIKKSLNG